MARPKEDVERRFDVEVGVRIARLRVERMVSQVELAVAIGVIPAMLYCYETGQTRCAPYRLRMIAEFLGIEIGELIPAVGVARYADVVVRERQPVGGRADRRAERMVGLAQKVRRQRE